MNNTLTYTKNGDYLIPDLKLSEQQSKPLGKYGRMRKAYLKEHRPILYNQLLMSEKLYPHLIEIDETAQTRLEQMMPQLTKEAGATEELKTTDPMKWGGPDEHLQSAGRGDSSGGAYQQLTLDLFLSEAEQIQKIDEAENVTNTFPAFSFAQKEIDHVLRLGGNTDHQRERIVAEFEKQKPVSEIAASLQALYHGGNGITTNTGSITAWYTEEGIRLSRGKSARYDKSAQVISWESAAERIGELLESGQFATNVELTEAAGYERSLLASKLWNLYHDFSDEASGNDGAAERRHRRLFCFHRWF